MRQHGDRTALQSDANATCFYLKGTSNKGWLQGFVVLDLIRLDRIRLIRIGLNKAQTA